MEDLTVENYLEEVKVFKEVTPEQAEQLLEEKRGNAIYIGFKKCPYSRKFVHTLSPLAQEKNLQIYYVDAKDPEHTADIKKFREKYDVKTVPGLLYSSETAGIVVKTDSSLSATEIMQVIEVEE